MRQSGDKTRQAGAKTGLLFPVKAEEDIKEGGAGNDQWTGRFFRRALTPESRVAVTRDLDYVPGGIFRPRFRLPARAGVHTTGRVEIPFVYNCEAGVPGHHAHSRDNA